MERNIDKIKRLEFDLAKKTKEAAELRKQRERQDAGGIERVRMVDAIIANCAIQFGEETEIGYRLALPKTNVHHILEKFVLEIRGESADGTDYIFEAVEIAKVAAEPADQPSEAENGSTD